MCGIFGYKGEEFSFEELEKHFMKIKYRGPDNTTININDKGVFLGFHRLSINDLSSNGNQPFLNKENQLMCNGEIYNLEALKKEVKYKYISSSDCEVLIPQIEKYGLLNVCKKLDAEFALLWYDSKEEKLMAARDPIGIRPLFWGQTLSGEVIFSSEMKTLLGLCYSISQFPPGHIWNGSRLISFRSVTSGNTKNISKKDALEGISSNLIEGVKKRLSADAPMGFLLSGGLDSSLICAIASKFAVDPIKTFSIGSNIDAIDNKYAEKTAKYIGTDHTTVLFTEKEAIDSLNNLIYILETWDITTVRASIGMNILCKWIKNNTNIKVIMTGEVSDELFGYKYTDYAPNSKEFQLEAVKRVNELHMYDVLRADRCISGNSLESRVPFSDLDFVEFVMSIPASMKMNTYGKGKFLLRKAFDTGILPEEILYREKAAFSDAVGHSIVDSIKKYANDTITDKEMAEASSLYAHATPKTKEALLYRKIFEKHYPNRAETIKDFWMPNKNWEKCNVTDPSARALPNYGDSGE